MCIQRVWCAGVQVDPIELVVWLPAVCRKMGVPYLIVKARALLACWMLHSCMRCSLPVHSTLRMWAFSMLPCLCGTTPGQALR